MAAVRTYSNLSNVTKEDLQRFLSNYIDALTQQFNGGIEFQSNIRSSPLTEVIFTGSSDIHEIPHKLGIVPRGTLVVKQNAAASIYAPMGDAYEWTNTKIFLQSSAAVTVNLYII